MNQSSPAPDEAGLRDAVVDAVADVEPNDRLGAIRARTSGSGAATRRRWLAVGSTALLTAAAVTVAAIVMRPSDGGVSTPDVPVASDPVASPDQPLVPVYYVGPGATGPDAAPALLYRYFERGGTSLDRLMSTPSDPDYRTLWPAGSLISRSEPRGGVIEVTIGDLTLRDRPATMSAADAELAIQQVVYTLQAEAGGRPAVQFRTDDNPIDQVFGVPTSEPVTNASVFDVLSLMSISDPVEGAEVSGSFVARGVSNGFEASLACWLYVGNDGGAYGPFVGTSEGWMDEKLFPWELEIDLADVPPGSYSLECSTDDPTGGAEGRGADTDTRTIVVE